MDDLYFPLLKSWCDRLIELQVRDTGVKELDGGILCPACHVIHGRCPDAIYPMMYLADATSEEKYLAAARKLFTWQQNMLTDEGSVYNDGNSDWQGITVFAAISLCEALSHHGGLLTAGERAQWMARLEAMCDWLCRTLDENYPTNINYPATNAAAMALAGKYLARDEWLACARRLAGFAMAHFTREGFLRGEGKPREGRSPRGCYPVDIGYNVEESVPALVKCALALGDGEMLEKLREILRLQLNYFLPDGGWNNSFGTRNNKWTYWGSRTSDGCQGAYALLGNDEPLFAETARRNTALMRRCTHDGLLYGGPEYFENGEPACVHHTFTHANALTAALEEGLSDASAELPCDADGFSAAHDEDVDTWRITAGPWRATVTGYDYAVSAGHATGGTLSLLWHRETGPVLLSSVLDYRLVEPHNMQLTLQRRRHRPLTPRVEYIRDGVRYAQCYDVHASISVRTEGETVWADVSAALVDAAQAPLAEGAFVSLRYGFCPDCTVIAARVFGACAEKTRLVLPVLAKDARVESETLCGDPEPIFFLTGGFGAREYLVAPDENSEFRAVIRV